MPLTLPLEEIFYRFVKFREFDISELSFGKYVSLRSQGDDSLVALPVFLSRAFRHSSIYVRTGSGLTDLTQLRGKSVGVPETKLVLGKHSGRHALHKRCEELGFNLNKEELDVLYHRFTALADRKKGVMDEEIAGLIEQGLAQHQVVGD